MHSRTLSSLKVPGRFLTPTFFFCFGQDWSISRCQYWSRVGSLEEILNFREPSRQGNRFRNFQQEWQRTLTTYPYVPNSTDRTMTWQLSAKNSMNEGPIASTGETCSGAHSPISHRTAIAISCQQYLISTIMWNIERGAPWNANFVSSTGCSLCLPGRNLTPHRKRSAARRSSISTGFLEIKCYWLLPHGWFGADLETIFWYYWVVEICVERRHNTVKLGGRQFSKESRREDALDSALLTNLTQR